jgi:hypothetical protein
MIAAWEAPIFDPDRFPPSELAEPSQLVSTLRSVTLERR